MAEVHWLTTEEAAGWDDLAALFTGHVREAIPTERPSAAGGWLAAARHQPAHRQTHYLVARQGRVPVGAATFGIDDTRPASAWLTFLYVAPDHRGRGIGSDLLGIVREVARRSGRDRIQTFTFVGSASGAAFAQRAGSRPGLVTEQNRCPTARSTWASYGHGDAGP